MSHLKLPRRDTGFVELDLCFPCQGIWFDEFESYQISPEIGRASCRERVLRLV